MRLNSSSSPARSARRRAERHARRRPVVIAAGLALSIIATAGITTAAPASLATASGQFSNFAFASFMPTTQAAPVAPNATQEISTDAREALDAATAAMTAADTVAADVTASALDLGAGPTSVDTAPLELAVERLDGAELLPPPLVPDLTADVTALVASVNGQVSELRGRLDGAKAREAERVAAEKAQQAAEAAAAAESASSSSSSGTPVFAGGGSSGGSSPAEAQAIARDMLANYGWGGDQFSCLVSLWNRESGWNYQAYNAGSGAYGIPQALPGSKMASAGADWQTNAGTQIAWGLGYISGRYGTPCGAWSHSEANGWY